MQYRALLGTYLGGQPYWLALDARDDFDAVAQTLARHAESYARNGDPIWAAKVVRVDDHGAAHQTSVSWRIDSDDSAWDWHVLMCHL